MPCQILRRPGKQRNTGDNAPGIKAPRNGIQLAAALQIARYLFGIRRLRCVYAEFANAPTGIAHARHPESACESLGGGQAGPCQAERAQGTGSYGQERSHAGRDIPSRLTIEVAALKQVLTFLVQGLAAKSRAG